MARFIFTFILTSILGYAQAQINKIDFQEFTLDNGLHVILHQDKSTPIVAVSVMYHVGSKMKTRTKQVLPISLSIFFLKAQKILTEVNLTNTSAKQVAVTTPIHPGIELIIMKFYHPISWNLGFGWNLKECCMQKSKMWESKPSDK